MKKVLALLCSLTLLLGGCAAPARYQRYSRVFLEAFDTVITLTCYAPDQAACDRAASAFEEELWRLDAVFDRYEPHEGISGLFALNEAAGEWLPVEEELYALIEQCLAWRSLDGGRVNIALGDVLELWHQYREEGVSLPPMAELTSAAAHADLDQIQLDEAGHRVLLGNPEMSLDLGAVAKGWSVERLARLLDGLCPDYLIDAGGNVRAGTRAHDDRDAWLVGVTDPRSPSELLTTLRFTSLSAVTSGGYQRYYEVDGVRYHHLIDPDSLMPSDRFLQTTVLAEDSGLADYLSTALFLLPLEEGRALVEGLEGVEAIWVLPDGYTEFTKGVAALTAEE